MSWWTLCWLSVLLLVSLGTASDVPFVFVDGTSGIAEYTSAQIEQASSSSPDLAGVPAVSSPSENEVLAFPVTGGGNISEGSTKEKVGDLLKAFDERTDTENQYVLDEAALLAAKYPGDLTMDQICSIYTYLKNGDEAKKGWSYVRDRRGPDYYRYANESLKMGDKAGCSGVGDCDDFAILMSSLIESIGGTTRIILAHNNTTGGHAYTEVYLGNLNVQNNQVEGIASWLKEKFNADKIYTHIDTNTKDVWLNMDWGLDEKGIAHPGGPFFKGDKHIVLYIRDLYGKTALKLPIIEPKPIPPASANQPPVIDSIVPDKAIPQYAGAIVTWTAAASDPENDPLLYKFFLNGPATGNQLKEQTGWVSENIWRWTTSSKDVGSNQVMASVRDNKHAGPEGSDSSVTVDYIINATVTTPEPIEVNKPPVVENLTADKSSPQVAGTVVTWTAVASDPENDPLVYKFFLSGPGTGDRWTEETKWVSDNTWIWTTPAKDVGSNQVRVWVIDGTHAGTDGFDADASSSYELSAPATPTSIVNLPPVLSGLSPDKSSVEVGGAVTWTAIASDPENDKILYRFFLNGPSTGGSWKAETDWSDVSSWTWATSKSEVGTGQVRVWVRDGNHADFDSFDSEGVALFTIKENSITTLPSDLPLTPQLSSLTPDRTNPLQGGLPVKWTATVTDPSGDRTLYRFWLKGPSTGNNWQIVQDWSYGNTWIWATSPANAGDYTVYVYARDGKHAGPNGYDSALGEAYTVLQSA